MENNEIADVEDYKKTVWAMFDKLEILDNKDKEGNEAFSDDDDDVDYGDEDLDGKPIFINDYGDEGFEGGEDDMDDFEGDEDEQDEEQQPNKRQKN